MDTDAEIVNNHPLVVVLVEAAKVYPKPWFFRQGLAKTPENETRVKVIVASLEILYREGLVSKYDSLSPETGPGVVLTDKGRKVVMDPEARHKLVWGIPLDPSEVGAQIRANLRVARAPWVTRGLVLANACVFVLGAYQAWRRDGQQGGATASLFAALWPIVLLALVACGGGLLAAFTAGGLRAARFGRGKMWDGFSGNLWFAIPFSAVIAVVLWQMHEYRRGGGGLGAGGGLFSAYLTGFPSRDTAVRYVNLLNDLGGLSGDHLLDGGWWRMGVSSFVPMGGLGLLFGVWWLWSIGAYVERFLGPLNLLIVFVLGLWGYACTAMALTPRFEPSPGFVFPLVGSSGGVCALLGGLGMWVLLVGRYLPSDVAGEVRSQIITSAIFMAIFSLMSNVPSWSLLGGAIGGALAALALHFANYGPRIVRPLAWLALPAIAYLGFWYLDRARTSSEAWARIEGPHFRRNVSKKVDDAEAEAAEKYTAASRLIKWRAERREEKEVADAVAALRGPLETLDELRARLQHPAPYRAREVREVASAGEAYLAKLTEFYRTAIRSLEAGEKWTKAEEKARLEQSEEMSKAFDDWVKAEKELPGFGKRRKK